MSILLRIKSIKLPTCQFIKGPKRMCETIERTGRIQMVRVGIKIVSWILTLMDCLKRKMISG